MTNTTRPKRKLFTRRRFLIAGGSLVAAGGLGAGGFTLYDRRQRFGRDALHVIPDHRVDLSAVLPQMVISRGTDPKLNVRAAIEQLGGMSRLLSPNDIVLIKPNIGWMRTPEQAANTHPDVVAELVRLCREAGPKQVVVSDCPLRKSRGAFERSGILDAALSAGAEVIIPEDSSHRTVQISERLGTWDILEPFVTATKIINVPVAKSHSAMQASAGMKNWIGITNRLRVMFHNDIHLSVAELAALMRPTLTVVDATRVLMDGGPEGGNPSSVKQVNTVAAGFDPVALDAWACGLLESAHGIQPEFLRLAEQMGLGTLDYRSLQPVEIVAS